MTNGTTPVATEIPVWLALPVVSSTNHGMAMQLKVLPNTEIGLGARSPMSGRCFLFGRAKRKRFPPTADHTVTAPNRNRLFGRSAYGRYRTRTGRGIFPTR